MNRIILCGRLTKDPQIRFGGAENICIAGFSLAVDRRFKKEGQPQADFFNCTAFRKTGEFVQKYLHKGSKILIDGEMQNDNYQNKEGQTVYGFRVIVNSIEFAESKKEADAQQNATQNTAQDTAQDDGFMNVPDSVEETLPFN